MSFKYHVIYFVNKLLRKNYPCGRTKKNKHLSCKRKMTENTVFYSEDRKKVYCKYCGHLLILSSSPITSIEHVWE